MRIKHLFPILILSLLLGSCQPTSINTPTLPPSANTPANYPPPSSATPAGQAYPSVQATKPAGVIASVATDEIVQSLPAATLLTDGLGRKIALMTTPRRIVSLAPSNTEILFAVGAGAQVVGRDEFSDYPAEAKALPSVGGSMGKYNLEQIAALKPDLVLASELNPKELVKSLEDLKLTVFYLANPTDLDGTYANLETVAAITGHQAEATSLIASLKQRVKAVEDKLSAVTTRPTIYYELDASDPAKPFTSGPGTFVDRLISLAGGQNIASDLGSPWGQIAGEQILARDPDIILLGDGAYGVTPASLAQRPGWSGLKALKENKVYTFDDNLVSRPTPRLVDGLETLVKLIHPEVK